MTRIAPLDIPDALLGAFFMLILYVLPLILYLGGLYGLVRFVKWAWN